MTLLASFGALCAAAAFWSITTACGLAVLRIFRVSFADELTRTLTGSGVGVVIFCVLLDLAQFAPNIRFWVIVSFCVIAILAAAAYRDFLRLLSSAAGELKRYPLKEKLLCAACGLVILFAGFTSVAPLTGSDAMHYHFATPLVTLRQGFHPDFFLAHSFLTGQNHLLILAGLALGSEKFALSLVFLGGILAAAATCCLARKWTSGVWPWLALLVFLLTPVVFWQMTAAGAPDIWMAFFATMSVLLIAQIEPPSTLPVSLVAGLFAGAVAGGKYTGMVIAAALAIALLAQTRSPRRIILFFVGAIGAGNWPYARNWCWTGDPLFPFLGKFFHHLGDNPFALAAIRADTGGTGLHLNFHVLAMPLFASFDAAHPGFWQFFGPLCLMLAPILIYAVKNTPLWRTAIIVWLLSSIFISATSGMVRFLLPAYPIAVAAAIAGAAHLNSLGWRQARWIANASLALFLLMGAGGLALYGRQAARASVGMINREDYLRMRAQDFPKSEFVNTVLQGRSSGTRTLVFFRHLYYLRVPYVYGDPDGSWAVDPSRLNSAAAWRDFLGREKINWVVRSPDYPASIAAPLHELEASRWLQPVASATVSDIEGIRLQGRRSEVAITILCVANATAENASCNSPQ